MKPSDGNQIQCPCCKECKDWNTGFQKIVDLKNAGLVIYRHTTRTEDVNKNTGIIEFATKTTEDVFILHNTKDMDITSADYLPEIEQKTLSCPRCRKIIEHAQKLLQKVPTINKNDVKGICEHCRTKEAPCFECQEVVKKFVVGKTERTDNTKERVKQWLLKIKKLLNDAAVDTETGQERVRARSELYIDQLCRDVPNPERELEVKQMFHPEIARLGSVEALASSTEKRKKMSAHFPQLENLERPVVFIDSPGKVGKHISKPADRDNIYFSDVDSDDLKSMFYTPITEEEKQTKQKKERHAESRYHIPPVPFQSNEDFTEKNDDTIKLDKNQRAALKKKHSVASSKDSNELNGKIGKLPKTVRKYHSEEALLTTVAGVTKYVINQDFSYVFPKMLLQDKKKPKQKNSSELIKDTQDMLLAKEEEKKKKLEEEEKKKQAREEKRKQLEAKKKADEERKRLEASEKKEKLKAKVDTDKIESVQKDEKGKNTQTVSTATSKSKSKESRPVSEKKETKSKEPKAPKEPKLDKDAQKAEKNALKADRDAEKAIKEQEKKEKEERLKKEKEEKERLKKEKEKQIQADKELKQKEKDLQQRQKDALKQEKNKEKEKPAPKQKDEENKHAEKNEAEKRAREEAKLQLKNAREAEAAAKPEPEIPKVVKKVELPNTKELNIKSIKTVKQCDDLILNLVKLKQSTTCERRRAKHLSDLKLTKKEVLKHKLYHKNTKTGSCFICLDSDIELDVESLDLLDDKDKWADVIIGPKIFKYKPPLIERKDERNVPLFFQSTIDHANLEVEACAKISPALSSGKQLQGKHIEQEVPKGVIRYALSDRSFIDKGWTVDDVTYRESREKGEMNVYRMRPAHPEFDWFEHNKNKRLLEYDSGEKLAEFDDKGRGRWFYKNGRMALDYYDAEELNAQQRFVIYSSGEPDERNRARPYTLLATFDYLGNGIVFDHTGKIRLKYNQTEGVILDRSIGPVSQWKWHTLNDPPVLQQVMIDTQMAHKDPYIMKFGGPHDDKSRPDNEDMLAIEFDNFIKEKSKKLSQSFKPFQIKMKALKINEHFSLKVLDQATVYLIFRDGTTNLKLNVGMVLDHKEIVDTDTAEVGEVSNNMERLPARTDSLAQLQKSILHSQHYDRTRTERELRLRPTMPCGSADRLVSAASRPLRLQLRAGPSGSTTAADCYCMYSRKPTASTIYCASRFC